MTADEFWSNFLTETHKDKNLKYADCYHFENSERAANALLELVLKGIKKATSSSLAYYEVGNISKPQIGDFCIITDFKGEPKCVVETTQLTQLPFCEVTFETAKREGEDEDLESWRQSHREYFTYEGKELGYDFNENMTVLFEDFEVVYTR